MGFLLLGLHHFSPLEERRHVRTELVARAVVALDLIPPYAGISACDD